MVAAMPARFCGVPSNLIQDQQPVPTSSFPVAIEMTESNAVLMDHSKTILMDRGRGRAGKDEPGQPQENRVWDMGGVG